MRNNALKNDLARLAGVIIGPGLMYLYVQNYFKDVPAGVARVAGTPVVARGVCPTLCYPRVVACAR